MTRAWRARLAARLRAEPRWVVGLLAVLFLAGSIRFFAGTRKDGSPEVRIGVDGRYHWAYLTTLLLDRDLDFTNQYADPESGNYYAYGKTPTGRYANPFPLGPAVAWAPFFAVAHGVSRLVEPARARTGNSHLQQRLTLYGSYLFGFAAGLLAYGLARRRYGPAAALAGAIVAVGAGPLLQYTLNQPSYAHAPSALAVAALLWAWDTGRPAAGAGRAARGLRGWLLAGALVGLAALMRAQNVVFAAPLVAEGAAAIVRAARHEGGGATARTRAAARAALAPLAGGLLAVVLFAPQMVVWKLLYGHFLGVPQGPGYMRWTEPLWAETLFSSRNGLFPYAPLWAIGALGLVAVTLRDRVLGAGLLVTFALTAYLNGASSDWSGGGAYGGRRYDGLLVHVALGFAAAARALADAVERRPRAAAGGAIGALVLFGGTCNYLMTDDYRKGRLHPSQAKDTLAYYDSVGMRAARALWKGGNPLSWPGALAFAWRTGAPASRYDEVVGAFFLTDFRLEAYRKRSTDKPRDELAFAAGGHAKFLVRGFGAPRGEGAARARPVVGARARFLVPLNHGGGVRFRLAGSAATARAVTVLWNGERAAHAALAPGATIGLAFELGAARTRRGVNVVDLIHEGVAPGEEAASYVKLAMEER